MGLQKTGLKGARSSAEWMHQLRLGILLQRLIHRNMQTQLGGCAASDRVFLSWEEMYGTSCSGDGAVQGECCLVTPHPWDARYELRKSECLSMHKHPQGVT